MSGYHAVSLLTTRRAHKILLHKTLNLVTYLLIHFKSTVWIPGITKEARQTRSKFLLNICSWTWSTMLFFLKQINKIANKYRWLVVESLNKVMWGCDRVVTSGGGKRSEPLWGKGTLPGIWMVGSSQPFTFAVRSFWEEGRASAKVLRKGELIFV